MRRVHDMVLDLIASMSNEENFLTTLGGHQPRSVPSKVRRLSLQTSKEEDAKKMPTISLSSVRSLTVFSGAFSLLPALSGFPVLRTLDLSLCREVGNHHMKDICTLLHLRFLGLKGTSITDIPKEIGNLQLLQMLDIRSLFISKCPSTFVQLRQLAFVDMDQHLTSTLLLRSMSSLPSLSSLAIRLHKLREEDLEFLGSIPSLRDLSIQVTMSRQGGEKRIVIGNGCPFRSLTILHIRMSTIDFVFTQGTLQMLRILSLLFDVEDTYMQHSDFSKWMHHFDAEAGVCPHIEKNVEETKDLFGDLHFGLENLASLEHVYVMARGGGGALAKGLPEAMSNALRKVLGINPNKPKLTMKASPRIQELAFMARWAQQEGVAIEEIYMQRFGIDGSWFTGKEIQPNPY